MGHYYWNHTNKYKLVFHFIEDMYFLLFNTFPSLLFLNKLQDNAQNIMHLYDTTKIKLFKFKIMYYFKKVMIN